MVRKAVEICQLCVFLDTPLDENFKIQFLSMNYHPAKLSKAENLVRRSQKRALGWKVDNNSMTYLWRKLSYETVLLRFQSTSDDWKSDGRSGVRATTRVEGEKVWKASAKNGPRTYNSDRTETSNFFRKKKTYF